VNDEEEALGLDISQHAEAAYGETWFLKLISKIISFFKKRYNGLIRFYHIVFILSHWFLFDANKFIKKV
jgi:hypothetical protein